MVSRCTIDQLAYEAMKENPSNVRAFIEAKIDTTCQRAVLIRIENRIAQLNHWKMRPQHQEPDWRAVKWTEICLQLKARF